MEEIKMKTKETTDQLLWAREKIGLALDQNGPYSHNICSLVLSKIAQQFGNASANKLIHDFELDKIYQIMPVKETNNGHRV